MMLPRDRSFWLIAAAIAIVVLVTLIDLLRASHMLNTWLSLLGVLLMLGGGLLRELGAHALGQQLSYAVKVPKKLIRTGIYARIRHPMYAGAALLGLGAIAALASLYGLLAVVLTLLPALLYRIKVEEDMLKKQFGKEYEEWASKTSRLIPGLL